VGSAPAGPGQAPDPIGVSGLALGRVDSRVGAWLIDSEIVGLVTMVPWVALAGLLDPAVTTVYLGLTFTAASFVYFVLFWTSDRRATPGMRFFHLRIGHAFDGAVLAPSLAARRWLALGGPIPLLYGLPGLAWAAWVAVLAWGTVLLVATARSPARQGPHDRIAGSVIVGPAGWTRSPFACLVVLLLMVALPVLVLLAAALLFASVQGLVPRIGEAVG
jgi:uncharacterized RDD family membrane protein YckC